jgi:hypothetical protein
VVADGSLPSYRFGKRGAIRIGEEQFAAFLEATWFKPQASRAFIKTALERGETSLGSGMFSQRRFARRVLDPEKVVRPAALL